MIIIKRALHTNHCERVKSKEGKEEKNIKFLASTNQIFSQYQSILSMSNRAFFPDSKPKQERKTVQSHILL